MIVGCDPGFTGALALVSAEGALLHVIDMPVLVTEKPGKTVFDDDTGAISKRIHEVAELDLNGVQKVLYEWALCYGASRFLIERVGARPEQGSQSTFKFGYGAGAVLGAAVGLGYAWRRVDPQRWKPAMRCTADKKLSCERARQAFPPMADWFKRVKDNGRAEAALIGLYGLRPAVWS